MAQQSNLRFYKALQNFKGLDKYVYHEIGKNATTYLWEKYLQGQKIKYRSKYDRRGGRTFRYSVKRTDGTVVIRSYPLNLWERGFTKRRLRERRSKNNYTQTKVRGKTVAGKFVLSSFRQDIKGDTLRKWTERAIQFKLNQIFK